MGQEEFNQPSSTESFKSAEELKQMRAEAGMEDISNAVASIQNETANKEKQEAIDEARRKIAYEANPHKIEMPEEMKAKPAESSSQPAGEIIDKVPGIERPSEDE